MVFLVRTWAQWFLWYVDGFSWHVNGFSLDVYGFSAIEVSANGSFWYVNGVGGRKRGT